MTGSLACMVDEGEIVGIAINPAIHQSDWRKMGLWGVFA
jgi:hypothetical protein